MRGLRAYYDFVFVQDCALNQRGRGRFFDDVFGGVAAGGVGGVGFGEDGVDGGDDLLLSGREAVREVGFLHFAPF